MSLEIFHRAKVNMRFEAIPGEWTDLHRQVIAGTHPQIPNFGHGNDSHLDYYGTVNGIEKGRIIIPDGQIEHSTHVSHSQNGDFIFVEEGTFLRTD